MNALAVKEKLVVPRFQYKDDGKDWARKILNNPKSYPAYSVKAANEALGL